MSRDRHPARRRVAPPWIRADGEAKATGQARYTADLAFPGLAHARLLLAGRAHARIVRLDTTRARALPGVLAVLTQDDVPDRRYGSFDYVLDRTLFARDVVRFEGEVVAAVAALTPEQAAAAVAAIDVEYEDLPPILDVEAALEPGSPLVHEAIDGLPPRPEPRSGGNVATPLDDRQGRRGRRPGRGADRRPRALCRGHGPPRPDRAARRHRRLVRRPGDDLLEHPGPVRRPRPRPPRSSSMPEHRIRVVVTHLGGGFGGKCDFHFEAHVAALARAARRPVRLVLTRREEFIAPDKVTHAMVVDLETGLDRGRARSSPGRPGSCSTAARTPATRPSSARSPR